MDTNTLKPLIVALIERQRESGMTDKEFARQLGVTRQAWQLYKGSGAEPSTRTLRRIAETFRDLKPVIWDFVMSENASKSDK